MNPENTEWESRLAMLRGSTDSDFCATALYDKDTRQIRWVAASGNTNQRYRHMVDRPGQGMAGEAVRIGRTIHRIYKPDEQPGIPDIIMVAEHLLVAVAVPLRGAGGEARGVILIGRRTSLPYTKHDLELLEDAAARIYENAKI